MIGGITMLSYLGYIIVFLLLLVCFLIYSFLLYIEKRKIISFFETERKKVEIIKKLIFLAGEVQKKSFEKTPNIQIYLKQADFIVKNKGFELKNVEISTLNKYSNDIESFNKESFYKEYLSASKTIRKMVDDCSETLGFIYQLNHPVSYAFKEFKKNMLLQILRIIVNGNYKRTKKCTKETVQHQQMNCGFINKVTSAGSFSTGGVNP